MQNNLKQYIMRKLVIAVTLLMICAISCTSFNDAPDFPSVKNKSTRYISSKEAYDIAVSGYHDFGFDKNSRSNRPASVYPYDTSVNQGRGSEQDSSFYIVNFIDGGFAVVAAQRNNPNPIFGIAEKGKFSADDNPNLQYYMELGKEYYANFPTGPWRPWQEIDSAFTFEPDSTVTYINRYVPTKWGQWSSYNFYCPLKDKGIGKKPAGCIPVAMGQIMAFHRFPTTIEYNDELIPLYWDEMLYCNNIEDLENISSIGVNDIQLLLHACGILSDVKYEDEVSFTTMRKGSFALNKIGFYAQFYKRPTIEQCITSLRDYGPFIMSGKNPEDSIGHAWVTDALKKVELSFRWSFENGQEPYRIDYYFDMNWGAKGVGDGFFIIPAELDSVIPPLKNVIYKDLECILNINPAT